MEVVNLLVDWPGCQPDIGRVKPYILMQDWRSKHPDIVELMRSSRYSQLQFSIELIRQLAGIERKSTVPLYTIP